MSDETLTLVFGDDRYERLLPLTHERVKAAMPFGGEYRIIDFVLTNCLHSGLRRILVLSSGRAHSLFRHLRDGWSVFNPALGEYITPFPAPAGARRAIAESLPSLRASQSVIERSRAARVVLLVGGHVYRMDYAAMLEAHRASGARALVATVSGRAADRSSRPMLILDGDRVRGVRVLRGSRRREENQGQEPGAPRLMGAYVFETRALVEALGGLEGDLSRRDFVDDFLQDLVARGEVAHYEFGGSAGRVSRDQFWAELESLDSYFEANLALLDPVPPINLYQTDWPVWSYSGPNPPARTVESASGNEGLFVNSVVSNGTVIAGGAVSRSVLGRRVRVDDSAVVERAILFDDVHIGEGAEVRNCIVDKEARIAPGERIGYDPKADAERFTVTPNGVVVVPRDYAAGG